jgi:hypothetical protein
MLAWPGIRVISSSRPRAPVRMVTARMAGDGGAGRSEPTIALLRRLAGALNADVRLTAGHDLGSLWFETHAA